MTEECELAFSRMSCVFLRTLPKTEHKLELSTRGKELDNLKEFGYGL